jgi:hypothetical protein
MGSSIGTVLGGGASLAEQFTDSAAARNAYNEQKRGLAQQRAQLKEDYNLDRVSSLVQQYDKGYLDRKIELQKQYEPELYAAGQKARADLLAQASQPTSALESTRTAKKLFAENIDQDPALKKLKDTVVQRANDLLSLGGSLPPEYQAELVRAGVGQAAQAGIKPQSSSVGGVISNVLGSAGEKLRQARTVEAAGLANVAQQMTESRAKILGSIFPSIQASEQANIGRTTNLLGITNALMPNSATGLTGREAVNLDFAGREAQRNIGMSLHNLKAQYSLEKARILDNTLDKQAGGMGGSAPGSYGSGNQNAGGGGGMDIGSIVGIAGMLSDKNSKENIKKVDEADVLDKVSKLPVSNWEYKKDIEGVPAGRHTGPMAQDWSKLFGDGSGKETTIPIVDAVGVTLASIKAIVKQLKALQA